MLDSSRGQSPMASYARVVVVGILLTCGLTVIGVGQAAAASTQPTIGGLAAGSVTCGGSVTTGLGGAATGGAILTICGTNFGAAANLTTKVYFGSSTNIALDTLAPSVTIVSASRMTVTVPAAPNATTPSTIFVFNPASSPTLSATTCGAVATACQYTYTWPASTPTNTPTISSVSPATGPLAGGTSVTITGDYFFPGADLLGPGPHHRGAAPGRGSLDLVQLLAELGVPGQPGRGGRLDPAEAVEESLLRDGERDHGPARSGDADDGHPVGREEPRHEVAEAGDDPDPVLWQEVLVVKDEQHLPGNVPLALAVLQRLEDEVGRGVGEVGAVEGTLLDVAEVVGSHGPAVDGHPDLVLPEVPHRFVPLRRHDVEVQRGDLDGGPDAARDDSSGRIGRPGGAGQGGTAEGERHEPGDRVHGHLAEGHGRPMISKSWSVSRRISDRSSVSDARTAVDATSSGSSLASSQPIPSSGTSMLAE